MVLSACSGGGDRAPVEMAAYRESELAGIYARMEAALADGGEVYRGTVTSVLLQEPFTVATTSVITADARAGRARVDVRSEFDASIVREATWIIHGERWYQTTPEGGVRKREVLRCRGSESAVLSLLLGCRGAEEEGITAPIGEVEYEGRRAIAIVTVGSARGVEETTSFTETLFVDAETWLPLGLEGSGRLVSSQLTVDNSQVVDGEMGPGGEVAGGAAVTVGKIVRFEHGFVAAGEVDAAVFDPATIGWEEVDPAAPLLREDPDFTYYWLGREMAGDEGSGRPALALEGAYVAESAVRPVLRYRALLKYRAAADEFGETLVEVVEWRADEASERWTVDSGQLAPPVGCVVLDEYEVSLGRVTVFGPAALEEEGQEEGADGGDSTHGEREDGGDVCGGWSAVVVGELVVIEIRARGESRWGTAEGMGVLVGAVEVVGE
jgi:hypothetical protein